MALKVDERRALQAAVGLAAAAPVFIGLWGVLAGFGAPGAFADSQFRFLSGMLLGVGLMFWATIPRIETHRWPFRMLCALVVFGGMARVGTALASGLNLATEAALTLELIVTPALFLWRERLDARASVDAGADAG